MYSADFRARASRAVPRTSPPALRRLVVGLAVLVLLLGACDISQKGPDPTEETITAATGPYATATEAIPAEVSGFGGGVIHYPAGTEGETFGAVAIAPGFLGSSTNYAWMGPRFASHGFVVLLMDTQTRTDLPPSRGQQLLAALDYLVGESSTAPLVDGDRLAVAGHSMGGGGALEAAAARPDLVAALALQPWHTTNSWPGIEVPTLVVGAQNDTIAPVASHAEPFYESIVSAPEPEKAYVELAGAPHSASTAGDATQARFMLVWLKRFVDDDARYEPFVCDDPGGSSAVSEYRGTCPTVETSPAISGVVRGPGAVPVAGATVWAYGTADRWVGSGAVVTGIDGRYTLSDLDADAYRIRVVPPASSGLAEEWFDDVDLRRTATPVEFAATPIEGIDVELEPAGSAPTDP